MADSRTELILQAVVNALNGAGKPSGVTVDRDRRRPFEKGELGRMSVYPLREEPKKPENRRHPVVERELRVQVKCRVVGTDQALDPLRKWAVKALQADPSLGGLALAIDEDATDWDGEEATDGDYSIAHMDFLVRYQTSRKDLEVAA